MSNLPTQPFAAPAQSSAPRSKKVEGHLFHITLVQLGGIFRFRCLHPDYVKKLSDRLPSPRPIYIDFTPPSGNEGVGTLKLLGPLQALEIVSLRFISEGCEAFDSTIPTIIGVKDDYDISKANTATSS